MYPRAATLFRIKLSTDTGFLLHPPTEHGRCSSALTKSPCKQLMGNHKHHLARCISEGESTMSDLKKIVIR
jgi:hypothetical protein